MKKGFPNIITKGKKLRNDDRYWRPRQDEIREGNFGDEYEEIFGYAYKINGKYYDNNFIEVKK